MGEPIKLNKKILIRCSLYNIMKIHNNVLWDWQYYMEYSEILSTFSLDIYVVRFENIKLLTNYAQNLPQTLGL